MTKAMKGIGAIKRLSKMLPRHSFLTIYKSFVRPHLDYGDTLYDQPNNKKFCQKMRLFNTMLLWPLQVPSSQIKQQIRLRISSLDGGSEDCFFVF